MCWILLNNGSRQRLRLRPGTVLIGRAQTAHIRPNHQSVSRVHAEIIVDAPSGSLQDARDVKSYPINILDHSSTGHTFVNTAPAGMGVRKILNDGDTVCFGVDPVSFSLQWSPIVLSCSSRMDAAEKQSIEGLAGQGGVFLTPEWASNCTHLLMEQLSITPKLLCCVIDGGVPVSRSFLEALAAGDLAGPAPDHMLHQPRPPNGADAAYAAELANCIRSPRPRHHILQGVWILFASQQAYEALNKALTSAGSRAQFICTSLRDVTSVAASMTECKTQQGAPEELWVVPNLEESIASALSSTLLGLGAKKNLAVPLQAMVVGMLKGQKDGVHSGASRISLVKGSTGYLETQSEALRPGKALTTKDGDVKAPEGIKEETFPHTQEQPPVPLTASPKVQQDAGEGAGQAGAKRQRVEVQRPTTLSTGRFEPMSVKFSNSQDLQPKLDVAAAAGMAQTVSSYGRAKSEAAGLDVPFSVSSDAVGGLKEDGDKLKVEAALPPPATISSCGGPTATPEGSGMPKILSINFDTPMTQAKPEDNKDAVSDSINVTKVEIKPKEEVPAPAPAPPRTTPAQQPLATAAPARIDPVVHPSGVWLPKKAVDDRKKEPFVMQVPGMGDRDLHSLRAATDKGAVKPVPARTGIAASSGPVPHSRNVAGGDGTGRRSFKLFKKARGQNRAVDALLVPTSAWAPAPGPGLGEIFASHRMESDSQLPPV